MALYAQWEPEVYTVRFLDEDGTVLQTGEVTYGDMPEYTGKTPEKAADEDYTYSFGGWDQEIAAAEADTDYTAVYEKTPVEKETETETEETKETGILTFNLGGGTLDGKTGTVTYEIAVGEEFVIPEAPVRDGYTFLYWEGSIYFPGDKYLVEGDHTFTAVWEKAKDRSDDRSDGKKNDGSGVPNTGDSADPGSFMMLMAFAAVSLAAALILRGGKQKDDGHHTGIIKNT